MGREVQSAKSRFMKPVKPGAGEVWILFDGVCLLCQGWVRFLIRHDPNKIFRFAPLQEISSQSFGFTEKWPDSIVVVGSDRVSIKSAGIFSIIRNMSFPWRFLLVFQVIPSSLLDWLYDKVAQNRYNWFGKKDTCMMPGPGIRERFLNFNSET